MKKQVSVFILGVCMMAVSASAQYVLREPFVAVTGAPATNKGEYQASLDLGGVTNCARSSALRCLTPGRSPVTSFLNQ
jgi:hypothetical protein